MIFYINGNINIAISISPNYSDWKQHLAAETVSVAMMLPVYTVA
jgi:hypothetical protein